MKYHYPKKYMLTTKEKPPVSRGLPSKYSRCQPNIIYPKSTIPIGQLSQTELPPLEEDAAFIEVNVMVGAAASVALKLTSVLEVTFARGKIIVIVLVPLGYV